MSKIGVKTIKDPQGIKHRYKPFEAEVLNVAIKLYILS